MAGTLAKVGAVVVWIDAQVVATPLLGYADVVHGRKPLSLVTGPEGESAGPG